MKSKLLIFVVIITVLLTMFAVPVLAAQKVVDISRPEGKSEIVTKETFSICGSSINDEATVELYYKDKETRKFEPLETTEGESVFTVGKLFGKDIQLKMGENVIRVVAYTDATIEKPQIETYTITLVEEKVDNNWLEEALDWFTGTDAAEKK